MSRTYHHGERHIRVRGVRRDATDLRRLAVALLDLAQAQAETDAQAEHKKRTTRVRPNNRGVAAGDAPEKEAA